MQSWNVEFHWLSKSQYKITSFEVVFWKKYPFSQEAYAIFALYSILPYFGGGIVGQLCTGKFKFQNQTCINLIYKKNLLVYLKRTPRFGENASPFISNFNSLSLDKNWTKFFSSSPQMFIFLKLFSKIINGFLHTKLTCVLPNLSFLTIFKGSAISASSMSICIFCPASPLTVQLHLT